ncbi:MAG TPA: PQQ-binding-like beta-propeller repeat protein [Opitutaceae bacterium]|nr:PQQ-binding-like beta-propeller repeat protein [Opitutaceae bacterium]
MRFTLLLLLSLALRAVAADPIEGFWLGETEMERQRYQIGFEFRPDTETRLVGRQWFAVLHVFGNDIGETTREGEHYRNANLGLDLVLHDDELVGTVMGDKPVRLHRSEALLTTPVTPAYPQGPAPVWTYRAGAALWGTPAADSELAFVGDERGVLHAVRLADSTCAWTFESGSPIHGRALLTEGSALVLNDAGELLRLDRATGKLLWRAALGGGEVVRHLPAATEFSYDFTGPTPSRADGTVYVPAAAGDVVAVDFASGETRWRANVGGLLRNSVLVAGDRLIVGSWSGRVTALARADGAKLWSFETGQPVTADPVLVGDAVLVSSRNSKLYSLALADGTLRWERFHAGSWVESAPRLVDGVLYLGSSDLRTVAALDPQTGAQHWSTDVLGWTWGTPAVVGDTVFAGAAGAIGYPIAQDGGMVALDRRTGAPKWRVRLAPLADRYVTGIVGSPTVAGSLVLFASQDGVLYALPTQ